MKKTLILFAAALTLVACNEQQEKNIPATKISKEFKTAYIDTDELMKESIEAKDIKNKYKAKSKQMEARLTAEINSFKNEAANFRQNAMANGQAWAQQKGAELQKREQELGYKQQSMMQELQEESGTELDTLIKNYRKLIKDYGKEKGFDYIYGTGETSNTVLYAKDSYDITNEIIKSINDNYKSGGKGDEKESKK